MMQVKLKVIGGKNDGREIKIAVPEFIIGRGEEAHLKPASDLISRQHCSIRIEGSNVVISDMGSRNGTFINGQQLTARHNAKVGDILRVGRLQFEILIDVAEPSNKRPRVDGVAGAVARTAESSGRGNDNLEDSITSWLVEEQDNSALSDTTTQLSLEDTKAILAEAERKAREKEMARKQQDSDPSFKKEETPSSEKKIAGKLPPLPKFSHDSSKVAADDVLRKFFNRR
jgi:pSer/pThr/pTyr-binding forkhead associated (FHA) protein